MRKRLAVLASGTGSNLRAVYAYFGAGRAATDAEIALVASDKAECGALRFAREHDVAAARIATYTGDARALAALLREHRIDVVVLGGYLRLVPPEVVREYRGRMVNIHPALLPAFGGPGMYGGRVHRAVLARGARVSGATAHFVNEDYDRGACIAQWPVPVFADDSPATLAARVLRVEHLLLPRAIHAVVTGAVRLDDAGQVTGTFAPPDPLAAFALLTREDDEIAQDIAHVLPR